MQLPVLSSVVVVVVGIVVDNGVGAVTGVTVVVEAVVGLMVAVVADFCSPVPMPKLDGSVVRSLVEAVKFYGKFRHDGEGEEARKRQQSYSAKSITVIDEAECTVECVCGWVWVDTSRWVVLSLGRYVLGSLA